LPNKDQNWIACVQNRGKWKEVVEEAKTFNSAPGRRRRRRRRKKEDSLSVNPKKNSCKILVSHNSKSH
jgi:hypothetical protein